MYHRATSIVLIAALSGSWLLPQQANAQAGAPTAAPTAQQPAPAPTAQQPAPAPTAQQPAPAHPPPPPPRYRDEDDDDDDDDDDDTLPYVEGQPPPAGYAYQESARLGLLIPGAITLGVSWSVTSLLYPVVDDDPNTDATIYIPVAGPWIILATRDDPCDNIVDDPFASTSSCEVSNEAETSALVFSGIAQVTGVTLLALGIALKSRHYVRTERASVTVGPVILGSGYGVGASGNF